MHLPTVVVTNFNKNFTGVSASIAAVTPLHRQHFDIVMVGTPLTGCPQPISFLRAVAHSRQCAGAQPIVVWHVRRNSEMQAALLARGMFKCPIKIVFTSPTQRVSSRYTRLLMSKMDAVIATSEKTASLFPQTRVVIPHGVDTNRFYAASDRVQAWQQTHFSQRVKGTVGIATIGRIRPEKGTDLFVRTMVSVLQRFPKTFALVIGRASRQHQKFLASLKEHIARFNLNDRFLFTGEIDTTDLPALVRGLSLLVALPRYEGYGLTPLEAMASGVPFVASDTGYYTRFAHDCGAGFVVPLGSDNALVAAATQKITDLLSNQSMFQSMAQSASHNVAIHYNVKQEAQAIKNIYDDLMRTSAV